MNLKMKLIGALVAIACVFGGIRYIQNVRAENTRLELEMHNERTLKDGAQARLAINAIERDSLSHLLVNAKELNGRLVAALRIHVPERDTLIVHDTLPTNLAADSTRTAEVHDSTFAGRVDGMITAKPCCAPLEFQYTLTRPAFDPEVGFVKVADRYVAVVNWQGEHFQVEAPYFLQPKKPLPFLGYFAEGGVGVYEQDTSLRYRIFGRGGVVVRGPAYWGLQGGLDTRKELFLSLRKDF